MSDSIKVRVYTSDVSALYAKDLFDALYLSVSDTRKNKIDSMRFQKDKCLSLGVEILLMRACRDFGSEYKSLTCLTGSNGKPFFDNCALRFNLSHSGTKVMCIMSEAEAGCDCEKVQPVTRDIAGRFFTASENAALAACKDDAERQDLFYRMWTLKESFMKCTSLGFRLPLSSFSIDLVNSKPVVKNHPDAEKYSLFELEEHDGYRFAYCVKAARSLCRVEANDIDIIQASHA